MVELQKIQEKLKAPKSQFNSFGKYNYRSCEDILEAVKPLLAEQGCTLTLSDCIAEIGGRIYVQATARIDNADHSQNVSTFGYAREPETKKGMDDSQITGAASSYARKYALAGLFLLDDTKDSDALNTTKEYTAPTISDTQAKTIEQLLSGQEERKEKMLKLYKVDSIAKIPAKEYQSIIKILEPK